MTNLLKHLKKNHPIKFNDKNSGTLDGFVQDEGILVSILIFNILFVNQNASDRLSFTLDTWTSSNILPFLGITAHWITRDWQLKEILLDFCMLYRPHSGENLAEVFECCC